MYYSFVLNGVIQTTRFVQIPGFLFSTRVARNVVQQSAMKWHDTVDVKEVVLLTSPHLAKVPWFLIIC